MYMGDVTSTLATGAGTAIGGPVGGAIGGAIGSVIGGILGGKPADHSAWAIFDQSGNLTGFSGNKQDASTTAAAQAIGNAMAARINAAKAAGVTISLPKPVIWVQIGERDPSIIRDASGLIANLAARGDTQGTMNAALNWIAQYSSNPAAIAVGGTALAPAAPVIAGAGIQPTAASLSVPGAIAPQSLLQMPVAGQPIIVTAPGAAPAAAPSPMPPWALPAGFALAAFAILSMNKGK